METIFESAILVTWMIDRCKYTIPHDNRVATLPDDLVHTENLCEEFKFV